MSRLRKPRNAILAGLVAAGAVAAAVSFWVSPEEVAETSGPTATQPWQGKVLRVARAAGGEGGLQQCQRAAESDAWSCSPARQGAAIAPGTMLRTDDRTRAHLRLGDGTRLALDRSTELRLDAALDRSGSLSKGGLVADVVKQPGSRVTIKLPRGRIEVLGTKFALRTMGQASALDVSRGAVMLYDDKERAVKVRAGEEGRAYPGQAPYASSAPALGSALSWSETGEGESKAQVRGLGELKAKKPGETKERAGAVRLTSHKVKTRIVDGFARTEVEEVFTNTTSDVLEGIYRFPMPPDAQIERLALEVDGELKEGAFVDRDRASAIWRGAIVNAQKRRPKPREEIIWVPGPWKDPALLEWQRGGRFELRIFPIPKNGSRRVVLTYTQVVAPTGGVRRYVYPLPHDPSGSTKVDDFSVDVQVRGHDEQLGISTHGYALSRGRQGQADSLTMHASGFVPTGDLVVEYATSGRDRELSAWAYAPSAADIENAKNRAASKPSKSKTPAGGSAKSNSADTVPLLGAGTDVSSPYVALSLRPKLPRRSDGAQRAYVLLVDASRSMYGERYRRGSELAARLVQELDRLDRFTVMACDTTCRTMAGGLRTPSNEAAGQVADFLKGVAPEGGSDPAASIRAAAAVASTAEGRDLRVVYIGDGTPTVGPIREGFITDAVTTAMAGHGTVTAVAIGSDADLDSLGAMARGGGGVVLPYAPGQKLVEVAYAILGASYGAGLSQVRLELPEGMVEMAPKQLDTIPAGGEAIVVARMTKPNVSGTVVLRGKVGDRDFEQHYPLQVTTSSDSGNAFVPRLYAAKRIGDLQREGSAKAREEAVALSSRFNVASRFTSLLVLESAAMFRAFGLDNSRSAPIWTGEQQATAVASKGQLEPSEDEKADSLDDLDVSTLGALGGAGSGYGDGKSVSKSKKSKGARAKDEAFAGPPPASTPRPAATRARPPAPKLSCAPGDPLCGADPFGGSSVGPPPRRRRGRRMIPMRRVWHRVGQVATNRTVPLAASADKISKAEAELASNPNRRSALQKLYTAYALSGELSKASKLIERWSAKEVLDPEALTARADLAARRGNRELAIRILGSVVDVRPGDIPSQRRLARLHRWAGSPALGCRHAIAIAQLRQKDAKLLAEAVFCGRKTGEGRLAEGMLNAASSKTRKRAETLLKRMKDGADKLRGELRLTATWQGSGQDLDIALIHPDGHRVSWLGAPTKAIITAEDVTSTSREGLSLLGSKAGEYLIEVVRVKGTGPVSGSMVVRAGGTTRTIPFSMQGQRLALGTVRMRWQSRLVRAW